MGWDYDALAGDASYHLALGWGGRLVSALDAFGALDWSADPPPAPAAVWEERDEDDTWPFESELDDDVLAYYGFSSSRPGKVPGLKLGDNSLWLVTAEESRLLADLIEAAAEPALIEQLAPDYPATLATVLDDFRDFCRAAAGQGGFWAY